MEKRSLGATNHEKLFPVLEELGITFVAFSPLANGLLSGAYKKAQTFMATGDYRNMMPQFTTGRKFYRRGNLSFAGRNRRP